MKYQLTPPKAQFDSNGLATSEGWAIIYETDPTTNEFKRATQEYFNLGVGLPAYAYIDKPKSVDDEHAIVWLNNQWAYPADHRGKTIYSTETGEAKQFNDIGDIPDSYTLLAPTNQFDSWNGSEWQHDAQKQHKYDVEQATQTKTENLNQANGVIANLQDAIDCDIATDEEKTAINEWKKYRVLLNRIDVNNAPNIDWPQQP